MKRIGFIDYYLSEWHANNYPAWIAQAAAEVGEGFSVAYAWAELETSPLDGVTSAQWCEKHGAELCGSLEELCEKSDVLLILAPSDPEKHLPYARVALRYGKPTYIDKTFAPSLEEAQEIFRIAEEHGTPFFSTSALRYASELTPCVGADNLLITAGGSNLSEYLVHPVEMAVAALCDPMVYVKVEEVGSARLCAIETMSGKVANISWSPALPYTVWHECGDKQQYRAVTSDFFKGLITAILRFYQDGKSPFDLSQTLEVMRIRDALLRAAECQGIWVE